MSFPPSETRSFSRARALLLVACATFGLAWQGGVARGAPAAPPGMLVMSVVPAADYARSHIAFAAGSRTGCQRDCWTLLRSTDGAHSWKRVAAKGWSGQPLFPAVLPDGPALLASGPKGIEISVDAGLSFRTRPAPAGQIDVAQVGPEKVHVLIAGEKEHHLLSLPDGRLRRLPASDMVQLSLRFNPSYPRMAAGRPAAIASGRDPDSGFPSVERCDATFACSGRSVVQANPDGAKLAVSPRFDQDGVLIVLSSKAAFRSSDGGRTFAPMVVSPPKADTIVTAVQEVAFAPDASRAFAAVVSVRGDGERGAVGGGVFTSGDGGASWKPAASPGPAQHGASTIGVAPDGRVLVGYLGHPVSAGGGVACSTDARTWRTACPAYTRPSASRSGSSGEKPTENGPPAPGSAASEQPGGGDPLVAAPDGDGDEGDGGGFGLAAGLAIGVAGLGAAGARFLRRGAPS